jgi:NADH:ubiquinone oxidoreductase subunit F (NADH-binding)
MTHAQTTIRTGARLLGGYQVLGRPVELEDHLRMHGPLPAVRGGDGGHAFIQVIDDAGLTGRGGGAFPTGRKLWAVAAGRRRPVVVVNAAEGEPASGKDRLLLAAAPHLVLDGAALAAGALDATEIIVGVHARGGSVPGLEWALARRRRAHLSIPDSGLRHVPARIHPISAGYVASEESALVNGITNADPRPTAVPPRPYERGVDGRPTLVLNAETCAHIALIARYGPEWFRSLGTADAPGTALFTLGGAVARPGVFEAPLGTTAGDLLRLAGGPSEPLQAVLTGGYGGAWLPLAALGTPSTPSAFAAAGAVLGPGILLALPARCCGLTETARVLRWLADQNAGQCGPCVFGLPAIADDVADIARGRGGPAVYERLERRLAVIPGRGACRHPDGAVRFARSALRVFRSHLPVHEHGSVCLPARRAPVLPLPLGW